MDFPVSHVLIKNLLSSDAERRRPRVPHVGIYLSVCDFCKRFNKIGAEGAKAIVDALKKIQP